MKQPKFKLGEMVRVKERPLRHFTIRSIAQFADGFAYSEDTWAKSFEGENSLELYQEPQKRKLYAYAIPHILTDHQRKLNGFEGFVEIMLTPVELSGFNRKPEYDIEYKKEEQ